MDRVFNSFNDFYKAVENAAANPTHSVEFSLLHGHRYVLIDDKGKKHRFSMNELVKKFDSLFTNELKETWKSGKAKSTLENLRKLEQLGIQKSNKKNATLLKIISFKQKFLGKNFDSSGALNRIDSRLEKIKNERVGAVLKGHVERKKIQKIIEQANQNINHPLTAEEFSYLADRSVGLRFSEKADVEFIEGGYGDAISLSGYPRAQLNADSGKWVIEVFRNVVKPGEDGPKILEERAKTFIKFSLAHFYHPHYGKNASTKEIINILQNTPIKVLLGNFYGATTPYELQNYYNLGKCGTKGIPGERMVKWAKLDDNFYQSLRSQLGDELNGSYTPATQEKVLNAMAEQLWTQARLHIRKLNLYSKL